MPSEPSAHDRLSRRGLLTAAGVGGAAIATSPLLPAATASAAELERGGTVGDPVATPRVAGLHLQFGADASKEVVVSWHTLQPVSRPQVLFGHSVGKYDRKALAQTTSYTDAKSGQVVYAHHARLKNLRAGAECVYEATHDGAEAEFGSFRCGMRG